MLQVQQTRPVHRRAGMQASFTSPSLSAPSRCTAAIHRAVPLTVPHWSCSSAQPSGSSRAPHVTCLAWRSSNAAAAFAAAVVLQASIAGVAHAGELQQQLCPAPQQREQLQQQLQQQQQQQQQQQPSPRLRSLADVAGLFDNSNDIDPFTLYGTNFKKFVIEQMQGEKVLSRQRGFTVDSCVSAIAANEETPEFNGLATREKVQAGEGLLCKRAVGPDLKQACKQSCTSACNEALAAYEERMFAATGFRLEPKDKERMLRNCRHSCAYECTKSGTAHDFVVTYRR